MPPRVDRNTAALITANWDQQAAIRQRVAAYVDRAWSGLGEYRDPQIDRFVAAVVPMVNAGQIRVAALTDAYLATLARVTLGQGAPVGIPTAVATGARGVDAADVYRRAGVTVWTALSNGSSFTDAVEQGRRRAVQAAETDLQLARTHSSRYVFGQDDRITGYVRVPGGRTCALCAIAATQRYHSEDLMPIHPSCSCGVEPIYGREDPGRVYDPDRLENIHDLIAEEFGADAVDRGARTSAYRSLISVDEHGELGPVLSVKSHVFTGPDQIP